MNNHLPSSAAAARFGRPDNSVPMDLVEILDQDPPKDGMVVAVGEDRELERLIDEALHGGDRVAQPSAEQVKEAVGRAQRLWSGRFAIGIELLPYRIVAALTDEAGARIDVGQRAIATMEVEDVVESIGDLVAELIDLNLGLSRSSSRIVIGVHLAGPVDAKSNTVRFYRKNPPRPAPMRPFVWENVPLGEMIRSRTGLETAVDNDANGLALFQQWFGAGLDVSSFGLILLRDGVGGSLVMHDKLFDGPFEIGNLVVYPEGGRVCDCGNQGCLEVTAGGYGITETAQVFTDREVVNAVQVAELVEEDSEAGTKALSAFRAAGIAIAKGLGFLVTLAAPEKVVLYAAPFMFQAGTRAADTFLAEARQFKRYVSHEAFRNCELVIAPLRPYEGAHAAAILALDRCMQIPPPPRQRSRGREMR